MAELDPTRTTPEGVIPINRDGRYCPLMRGKTAKVCHTCTFWRAMDLDNTVTGQREKHWRCVFVWQASLQGRANLSVDAHTAEVHGMRNDMASFKASVLELTDRVAAAQRLLVETETRRELLSEGEDRSPPRLAGPTEGSR